MNVFDDNASPSSSMPPCFPDSWPEIYSSYQMSPSGVFRQISRGRKSFDIFTKSYIVDLSSGFVSIRETGHSTLICCHPAHLNFVFVLPSQSDTLSVEDNTSPELKGNECVFSTRQMKKGKQTRLDWSKPPQGNLIEVL